MTVPTLLDRVQRKKPPLHVCAVCMEHIHQAAQAVSVFPSWQPAGHMLCRRCWCTLMIAAEALIKGAAHGCPHCLALATEGFMHDPPLPLDGPYTDGSATVDS